MNDQQLLTAYLRHGSQEAFRTIVRRYIELVYAAAVRKTSDSALAEEVTQAVFIVLARRAANLHDAWFLPAWLLQVTRHCAADARRSAQRRQTHEREAAAMNSTPARHSDAAAGEEIDRTLDEAIARLKPADRTAVVLRFYQGQSFAEVGESLGVSEDAAKKRLARALEKLRKGFGRRGVTFSAAFLAGVVTRQAVAAPAALAGKACTAALAPADAQGRFSQLLPPDAENVDIRLTAKDFIGYQYHCSMRPSPSMPSSRETQ